MSITDRQIRLAACALVRRRFSGRAELERSATREDDVALARLELALGLGTEAAVEEAERARGERRAIESCPELASWIASTSRTERVRAAMRGSIPLRTLDAWAIETHADRLARVARFLAPVEMAVRDQRAKRARTVDPLAERRPDHMRRAWAALVARNVIDAANFRVATHGHADAVVLVEVGREGASSSTDRVRPSAAGLSNAYAKKAYFVAQSEHRWSVSTAILAPEVRALNAAAPAGEVWLSTTVRVRQGRGTSLVCETVRPRRTSRAA